ncbi:hypothetical protein, partial [Mycobacterium sp.]|uniref:hypothetical protein n=1 Tax=Mycobacterium sp. TaxID=1785 RepID=UPI003BB09104
DPATGIAQPILDSTGNLNTAYGGYDLMNVGNDLIKLFENPWGSIDSADWAFLADPLSTPDPISGQIDGGTNTFGEWLTKLFDGGVSTAPDPVGNAAAAVGDSGGMFANLHADSAGLLANLHAELAAMLASMGGTAATDATGAGGGLFAEMAAQLSTDLATWFPNMF